LNSAVAARLHAAGASYFVKAMPVDARWVFTQRREAEVAPYVRTVAPAMLSRLVVGGWDVLVFEALSGHAADYAPDSPDLPQLVGLLRAVSELPCPPTELRHADQRLSNYVASADDVHYFAGGSLLHTDWNNFNVIVTPDGARMVDWGWATRGAAWLDTGYWVLWLIASGHDPRAAEAWAQQVPAWLGASPSGVTAFAAANKAMWAEIGGPTPEAWTARMMAASRNWYDYRTSAFMV
jgi:hypothetical protein